METPDAILSFTGELDSSRYPEIVQRFREAPDAPRIIVDLIGAVWIDSAFMGELMLFNRRLQKVGRSVVVVAKGAVARSLVVAGIDKRIPIVADPEAATLLA